MNGSSKFLRKTKGEILFLRLEKHQQRKKYKRKCCEKHLVPTCTVRHEILIKNMEKNDASMLIVLKIRILRTSNIHTCTCF